MDEFDLINTYFSPRTARDDVVTAGGDDAAVLRPPAGQRVVMTVDTLIAGVHFPLDTPAADVAYKAIAVNLSDLAAMGAEPAWLLLSLSLPGVDEPWLSAFADSFMRTCRDYHVDLVGGDTVRGELAVTVQATGFADADHIMRRDSAVPGDAIYVTGALGDAALALQLLQRGEAPGPLLERLNRPTPRTAFARALAGLCRCAIDISDGLVADLGHILQASATAAAIDLSSIPLSSAYRAHFGEQRDAASLLPALAGGDDYELCFCVADNLHQQVMALSRQHAVDVTRIGRIIEGRGIRLEGLDAASVQQLASMDGRGFNHFG